MDSLTDFTWSGFAHSFVSSLTVIIVSEIGDKTFFIAAIMAMRHSRLTVFLAAVSALVLMTVISVLFGWLATVIPHSIVYYTSTALFALFGIKMLWEGWRMPPTAAKQEMDRVQADLCARDNEGIDYSVRAPSISEEVEARIAPDHTLPTHTAIKSSENPLTEVDYRVTVPPLSENKQATTSEGVVEDSSHTPTIVVPSENTLKDTDEQQPVTSDLDYELSTRHIIKDWSRIFLQSFTMTFLSEWGDRSQVTTIVLAAKEDIYGVMAGGALGHTLCTGLAVLGGRLVAQRISVKTVTIIGGVVFLLFAGYAVIFRGDV